MASEEVEYSEPKRSGISARWEGFQRFCYNPARGEIMGRTAGSWGKIGIFYLIYYTCLAAFWAVLLAIFFQTVDDNRPTYTGSSSLLKDKPGLGYQPMPDYESTLIHFHSSYPATYKIYTDYLTAYLEQYKKKNQVGNTIYRTCRDGQMITDSDDKTKTVCSFEIERLEPCIAKQNYGYHEATPCVALKLNKVYGWKPENNSDVTIKCAGMYPADRDNIHEIQYFNGYKRNVAESVGKIDNYYFPFLSQLGYVSPLVMVKFAKLSPSTLIMVKCDATWLGKDNAEESASVRFEVLMQTENV